MASQLEEKQEERGRGFCQRREEKRKRKTEKGRKEVFECELSHHKSSISVGVNFIKNMREREREREREKWFEKNKEIERKNNCYEFSIAKI